ncbi:ExbD/TolR family protein [Aquirhabdus parva]|uniref:Biopolymer transporter ExbD n=1 Tax=Aquirhabdus parva TaxID=2283318 RepID=A0A345P687_9GAMM|nr:biopolymer transporter ExbD [Aquirhabdus parva]AXI02796.1 biopolymer transporter ExbD [Aquirhabdus parva]
MKFRKPQVEEISINLTPMIDCLLFLVVFLLVSTSFNKYSRLNLVLPQATGVPEVKRPQKIEVGVDAKGAYTVNGKPLVTDSEDELRTAIDTASHGDRTRPLVIAADGRASHQSVVRVMDVSGKLGFVNLNISTRIPMGSK